MENNLGNPVGGRFGITTPARQHSIYSLTLDEFQNTLGEAGKQFGSMNMDELLKNICTVEESPAMAVAMATGVGSDLACNGLVWQGSLPRQGSLTLPRTLSRKTVDEVWKDIIYQCSVSNTIAGTNNSGVSLQRQAQQQQQQPKEPTFGEITLEEFLMKAGVVREEMVNEKLEHTGVSCGGGLTGDYSLGGGCKTRTEEKFGENFNHHSALADVYANQPVGNAAMDKCDTSIQIGAGAILSLSTGSGMGNSAPLLDPGKPEPVPDWQYATSFEQRPLVHQQQPWPAQEHQRQQLQQQMQQVMQTETSNLLDRVHYWTPASGMSMRDCRVSREATGAGGILSDGFVKRLAAKGFGTDLATCFGCKMDASNLGLGPVSPCSPLSDEQSQDNGYAAGNNYLFNGILRGRKRGSELTIDKVVERRQRRMIKNRESAARSRARKQAYTVELEAELTQLKEENYKLRKQQEDADRKKKQLILDMILDPSARYSLQSPKVLRRTATGPW